MKKRKIHFIFMICLLCIFFSIPAAAKKKPLPEKLVLNRKEIVLYTGETKKLCVDKVKPDKASAKVLWSSKKRAVASVSSNGLVTAKKTGRTRITATSKKNPKVVVSVKVIVKKRPPKVEKRCNVIAEMYPYEWIREDVAVIRNREDIDGLLKSKVGYSYKSYRDVLKRSPLAVYQNMDFQKESLVLLKTSISESTDYRPEHNITFFQTKLDASGKLYASIFVPYEKLDDGYPRPTEAKVGILALRLKKRDAAMIDYYTLDYQEIP